MTKGARARAREREGKNKKEGTAESRAAPYAFGETWGPSSGEISRKIGRRSGSRAVTYGSYRRSGGGEGRKGRLLSWAVIGFIQRAQRNARNDIYLPAAEKV